MKTLKVPHIKKKKKILSNRKFFYFRGPSPVAQWGICLSASVGDRGSIRDPGRPHTPCAATTEPVLHSLRATTAEPMRRNHWGLRA